MKTESELYRYGNEKSEETSVILLAYCPSGHGYHQYVFSALYGKEQHSAGKL
jgi:hypothetical protein